MVLDEDEPVMYTLAPVNSHGRRYRCGSGFVALSYEQAVQRITSEREARQRRLADLRTAVLENETRSGHLKQVLQAKFGDAIQLEQ